MRKTKGMGIGHIIRCSCGEAYDKTEHVSCPKCKLPAMKNFQRPPKKL